MKRGSDTIGPNRAKPGARSDINSTRGDITGGDRKIAREGWRGNTVSGADKMTGPTEAKGAALVGEVMTRQEAKGRGPIMQDKDRFSGDVSAGRENGAVRFRIGDNEAKVIDMDRAPD